MHNFSMVRKIPSRECTRKKNLLRSSLPSSPQVYKPLFEAVGDGSGGKSLEDVFYEREVRPGARPLTLGASPRPGRRWALCPAGPVALLRWGSRTCPGLRRARRRSAEKAAVPASRGGAGGGGDDAGASTTARHLAARRRPVLVRSCPSVRSVCYRKR